MKSFKKHFLDHINSKRFIDNEPLVLFDQSWIIYNEGF